MSSQTLDRVPAAAALRQLRDLGWFHPRFCGPTAELPGIEPTSLPGTMPSELPVRSVSVRFSLARYLRSRSRVLTASMLGRGFLRSL